MAQTHSAIDSGASPIRLADSSPVSDFDLLCFVARAITLMYDHLRGRNRLGPTGPQRRLAVGRAVDIYARLLKKGAQYE